jgi:hypothetical protein
MVHFCLICWLFSVYNSIHLQQQFVNKLNLTCCIFDNFVMIKSGGRQIKTRQKCDINLQVCDIESSIFIMDSVLLKKFYYEFQIFFIRGKVNAFKEIFFLNALQRQYPFP